MSIRVALLTPFAPPSVRGNAITVERIARGLGARGFAVRVWDLASESPQRISAGLAAERPALIHAFHAARCGPLALDYARRAVVPLVITLTGTDANHDLVDAAHGAAVHEALAGALGIVAFHESIVRRVAGTLPVVAARITVIPQAVELGEALYDLTARWPLSADRVLFLFPAGVRPVKRPRYPLAALARLVRRRPQVRLAYAGPVIDADEGVELARALEPLEWARYLGPVPHAAMASLLRESDVVLNCSVSEGGMANAILEAQALGRAVLASDIEGNRSLVEDGVTGLLFRDDGELGAAAERLVDDPGLRRRLGAAARARVLAEYPPAREIDGYVELYRRVLGTPGAR